ncbi:unnamed protein product [Adineta steineri]|uniref:Uncharacterized protein n=1 Tax=Adineta steineri TaxID=433720 RepID=A0A814VE35_9BILA|nr:unnamed protein product [Adineta steineri]CAF3666730.1 unnamed protein product [Adineta steineri]
MAKIRLTLILLHVFITIFLIYSLHPHLSRTSNESNTEKQISSIIGYLNHLFCTTFYHSLCILALWLRHRYDAGLIRATGVLLIGELLQTFTVIVQHALDTKPIPRPELFLDVICVWIFLAAILLTFHLAKKVSKYEQHTLKFESIQTRANEESTDGRGDFSL